MLSLLLALLALQGTFQLELHAPRNPGATVRGGVGCDARRSGSRRGSWLQLSNDAGPTPHAVHTLGCASAVPASAGAVWLLVSSVASLFCGASGRFDCRCCCCVRGVWRPRDPAGRERAVVRLASATSFSWSGPMDWDALCAMSLSDEVSLALAVISILSVALDCHSPTL